MTDAKELVERLRSHKQYFLDGKLADEAAYLIERQSKIIEEALAINCQDAQALSEWQVRARSLSTNKGEG